MRLLLTLAACLAAPIALAGPARHHAPAPNGPECLTAATASTNVRAAGILAVQVEGDDARAMLDAINATGEPTDLKARSLVILLREDRVVVGLFDVCHTGDVTMSVEGFRQAYRRMRDGRA